MAPTWPALLRLGEGLLTGQQLDGATSGRTAVCEAEAGGTIVCGEPVCSVWACEKLVVVQCAWVLLVYAVLCFLLFSSYTVISACANQIEA